MEIRFHLDESVGRAMAVGLRSRGVDVTTTAEAQMLGAADREQIEYALEQGRVLMTHDDDFLRLAAAGVGHRGIVYCHQSKLGIGPLTNTLLDLWRTRTAEQMVGEVVFL